MTAANPISYRNDRFAPCVAVTFPPGSDRDLTGADAPKNAQHLPVRVTAQGPGNVVCKDVNGTSNTIPIPAGSWTLPIAPAELLAATSCAVTAHWIPRAPVNGQFYPSQFSGIGAWYRMAASTAVAGEWQTIVDVLGGTSLVQNDTDRRLAAGTSANGLPVGTYDGTDCMRMPLGSNNFNVNTFGLALWFFKTAGDGDLFVIYNNDAAVRVMDMYVYGNGQIDWTIYVDNANGRVYSTAVGALTNGAYNYPRIQFDSSKTNECDLTGSDTNAKVRIFVGETAKAITPSNFGAGGAIATLRTPTGAAIFGGFNDSDTPVTPMSNGMIHGPNTYLFTGTPTSSAAINLMNFETPT